MDGIFFLILAFLVSFFSVKLSYYGDVLSKQTKLGSALVGGLLIASITSLPELITSISAIALNNIELSFGDILGSNIFNIFVLSVFNIIFFNKDIFKNTDKKYIYECLILLIEYLFVLLGTKFLNISTISLIIMYILYILRVISIKEIDNNNLVEYVSNPFLKFIFISLLLILLSVLLTIEADKITHIYPNISSSSVGAILLGITTSLPEVVSTFALLKLGNINMAISNMLGSNIFNFLVLSLSDLFVKNDHIYSHNDIYSNTYLFSGILITFLLLVSIFNKNKNKAFYIIISIIMSFIYLLVWYFQFK